MANQRGGEVITEVGLRPGFSFYFVNREPGRRDKMDKGGFQNPLGVPSGAVVRVKMVIVI